MFLFALLFLFAVCLIGTPIGMGVIGHPLGTGSSVILTGSGVGLLIVAAALMIITHLYVKTRASEAFVRTGMGGMKVIMDGGSLVIPVVHQIVTVSLETMRLQVSRAATDALITKDKLRADVMAEFFVRVKPDDEAVKAAARSLGEKMGNENEVKQLVEDKLISALRTVAATKTLEVLNTERDEFVKEVTRMVQADLEHNGLMLEVVTISKLDQTDPRSLRADNIFDAQGLRTIAEVTQRELTARNQLERAGEQQRKAQDVETVQRVLELERTQKEAEAAQRAQVTIVQAGKDRESQESQIAAQQAIKVATAGQEKAVEVAKREAEQAIEVANRKKDEAVANAEAERAGAQAKLATAEAERERARQSIETVEAEAKAERARKTQVIAAEGEAERTYVAAKRVADAEAYATKAKAEGQKAAADAEAEAVTKKANAEASAAEARAKGARAEQMVPVEVAREQVGVKQREVEVLTQELEAREKHGKTAQDFEIEKLRVAKRSEVQIAMAGALATISGKVEAHVFGTPEDVARMQTAWMRGMQVAGGVDGFLNEASDATREGALAVGGQMLTLFKAVAAKVGMTGEEVDAALKPPKDRR